jgi:hypothetical protein
MVPKVLHWLRVDFTPICQLWLGYKEQTCIDPHHMEMASAAMVYFGLDPRELVRYLARKYTGQHQDVWHTLDAVQDHVALEDYEHIKWILLHGCPAQLTFEEPSSNKVEFIAG